MAYLFKHALTQASAYESLLVKKRREIHRHVAEAYEELYPQWLDELAGMFAHHYAAAGDDAKTVAYATRAGMRAATLSAYTEARIHFTTVLDALSRLPDTEQNRRARVEMTFNQVNVAWGVDSCEGLSGDCAGWARTLPGARKHGEEAVQRALALNDRTTIASARGMAARVEFMLGNLVV